MSSIVITPTDPPPDQGGSSSGGSPPGPSVSNLTRGLNKSDATSLREDKQTLEDAISLYNYARDKNANIRQEFDVLTDFAMGKQFLTYGDEIDHITSRPKRNIVFDVVRHKKGLVTEPALQTEVLPTGADAGEIAQAAKAAIDHIAERRDSGGMNRKDLVDWAATWAANCGTGIIFQGYDPVTNNHATRGVDPRNFDPDPDHALQSEWLYCFETLQLPMAQIKAMFPATGVDVIPDGGPTDSKPIKQPWQSSSDSTNIRIRRGSGQGDDNKISRGPEYGTVVLYHSQGHVGPVDEHHDVPPEFLRCNICSGEFSVENQAPGVMPITGAFVGEDAVAICPECEIGELRRVRNTGTKQAPLFPKGRRLIAFSPTSQALLYVGAWSTPELLYWPYKAMRWYIDPRRWWGIGEPQIQWSMQVAVNKLLVLIMENAIANAAPKVIIPRGIGFEKQQWTNMPSQKLVATGDPRLIGQMRSFQTGEVPQSLIFLVTTFIRELKNQGGFDDVALGQLKSNSELSGAAIERALSSAEVPVRDHLRQRYTMETQLAQDDLQMIRERWKTPRAIRVLDEFDEATVEQLLGDQIPLDMEVFVTSDPQNLVERSKNAEIALKLNEPDPLTGERLLDNKAVAEYVGIPIRILRGSEARRQRKLTEDRQKAAELAQQQQAASGGGGGQGGADLGGIPGLAGASAGLQPGGI